MSGLTGQVTIARSSTDHIHIEFRDCLSRVLFLNAYMLPDDFARAITGLGAQPCTFKLQGTGFVGLRKESKNVMVEYSGPKWIKGSLDEKGAREAVKEYEVDGWKGDWRDVLNDRRRTDGNFYMVYFHRYVHDDE